MEHKALSLLLKEDAPGSFSAIFSTLNVIDKDGDVTLPGAFAAGAPVNISAWSHNWGDLPVGDGKIHETSSEAIINGSFYLGTPQGDATYETLKQRYSRGNITQEWSYGFNVLESDFGTFEGKDVRFLKKLQVFEVSPVMVGAGENTRTLGMKGLTFSDHSETVLAALSEYVERSKELASLRAKEGRVLSAANRARLSSLHDAMTQAMDDIKGLLEATDPEKGLREAERVYAEFIHNQSLRTLASIGA